MGKAHYTGKDVTEVRSLQRKHTPDTVGLDQRVPTSLQGIAMRASTCKDHRFQDLYRLLNEELLLDCWGELNKHAAGGVDGVTFAAYGQNLYANVEDLVERLKTKRYRAKLVRRCYIPKAGNKWRALGIPALEDKLVQRACARILTAIYEQDFLPVSYGYRPKRDAKDAVIDLGFNLQYGSYGYVVESDIKSYFDSIEHESLLGMLAQRVDDKAFLGLIRRWLKAGILETDGEIIHPEAGSPQGGSISPILANVYLHHVLDQWFDTVVKPHCKGQAMMIRYADDYICAFQYQSDARRFYQVQPKRLAKFGLELAPEKTALRRFSRFEPGPRRRFQFLSIEFYWARGWDGEVRVKRRTAPKRLQAAKRKMTEWIKLKPTSAGPALYDCAEPSDSGSLQLLCIAWQRAGVEFVLLSLDWLRLQVAQSSRAGRSAASTGLDVQGGAGQAGVVTETFQVKGTTAGAP